MKKLLPLISLALVSFLGVGYADQPLSRTESAVGINGGLSVVGSIKNTAIGTPSAPTVLNNGTAGVTSIAYFCAASDLNGNDSIPSAGTTNTTSNASLSATNFNTIQCGGKVGAYKYKVLKTNTSTQLGTCNVNSPAGGGYCEVNDTGQSTSAYVPQVVDQTGPAGSGAPSQHKLVIQNSGMCSTSGGTNAVCGEATITGLPFADASYSVACSCVGTPGVGTAAGVGFIVKAAATAGLASNAQVFIGGPGAGTVSCAEVDCNFWHD